jgi:L,D-transpeptidase catalytic domain
MKIGSGPIAAAAMFFVLAAPPAFARNRHRSQLDSQEMAITNSPTREPVVAPPVTMPAWANYDTPRPRVASALPPLPVASENATSSAAAATSSSDGASGSPTDTDAATADGAQADGATTTPSQDEVESAAVTAPSSPEQQKEVAGPPLPSRTPGAILFDQTHDDSALDPMSWAVSIVKQRHELSVYYKGRLFKKYEAVFGRNLDNGAKLWAQDRRTPEGVYNIVEKDPSMRFHWFLRLNYPNLVDRVRYETLRVNGVVPVDHDGKAPEVGSAIGIHGTDVPVLNEGHINWTTGCISMDNKDIDDLERLLPVGTVVIIKP